MKDNQKGFSPIETVLVIIIVALVAFVAWYVFNTKSSTDTTYGNAANTQTEPSKNQESQSTKTNSTSTTIVQTKTDSKGTNYLADANGKPLYTYGSDTSGVSKCTGDCLTLWPIYSAADAPANLPTNVTVIARSDGGKQYAYKGMPLYHYTNDTGGSPTGDGVGGFSLAKP